MLLHLLGRRQESHGLYISLFTIAFQFWPHYYAIVVIACGWSGRGLRL